LQVNLKREMQKEERRKRRAKSARGLGFAKGGIRREKCWTWRNTCLVSGMWRAEGLVTSTDII